MPHFLGLHAIQIIPAIVWLLGATREARRRAVLVVSLSYAWLFAILLGQALGGQSVLAPQGTALTALTGWLAATALGMVFVWLARRSTTADVSRMVA